jgi:hypothetical protein
VISSRVVHRLYPLIQRVGGERLIKNQRRLRPWQPAIDFYNPERLRYGQRPTNLCANRSLCTSGTEGCGDSLGRGMLPSAASPGARLLLRDSPWACRSPDPMPSRPYSRCVGRPAFIDESSRGSGVEGFATRAIHCRSEGRPAHKLTATTSADGIA